MRLNSEAQAALNSANEVIEALELTSYSYSPRAIRLTIAAAITRGKIEAIEDLRLIEQCGSYVPTHPDESVGMHIDRLHRAVSELEAK